MARFREVRNDRRVRPALRLLRPTLAAWGLALLARHLLGCSGDVRANDAPDAEPPALVEPFAVASHAAAVVIPAAFHAATAERRVVTLSAVGDCTLGDDVGSERAKGSFHRVVDDSGGDLARPFSLVKAELDKDDLTIANLEGTLTTAGCPDDPKFRFRGRPEFARMLARGGVELVTLANNHSEDCGLRGLEETKASLDAAGVGWFGLGKVDRRTVHGIEIVNLGYTGGRAEIRGRVARDVAREKKPDNLVVVSFHWGIESQHAATDVQVKLAHTAIDAGADLVLGHHPHVLQGIEEYKGKRVVYSLGNFVFGGNAQPGELASMIYRARFEIVDDVLEPSVEAFIPIHISGDAVQNDFRPLLAEGKEADDIRSQLDRWSTLLP